MADRIAIEWTDATWNPLRGCSRVSAGCQHCYAERVAARFSGPGMSYEGLIHPTTKGWNGKVMLVANVLDQPLRWKRPRMIFVNSMSDLFHESVPFEWIDRIWGAMSMAPRHTFQVLTKRPERMLELMPKLAVRNRPPDGSNWPLRNVWLGVSVENQATADERVPLLLQCPAAVRWLSCEPLLGRVDLCEHLGMWWNQKAGCFEGTGSRVNASHFMSEQRIGWVVAGGESGPGARPMHPAWARSLRDQCAAAGVPFFFKQWGEFMPADDDECDAGIEDRKLLWSDGAPLQHGDGQRGGVHLMARVGKKAAGSLLDGVEHKAYPGVCHG